MTKCRYCSAEMSQDQTYCSNCGQYPSRREALEARSQIVLPFYREAIQQRKEESRSATTASDGQQA